MSLLHFTQHHQHGGRWPLRYVGYYAARDVVGASALYRGYATKHPSEAQRLEQETRAYFSNLLPCYSDGSAVVEEAWWKSEGIVAASAEVVKAAFGPREYRDSRITWDRRLQLLLWFRAWTGTFYPYEEPMPVWMRDDRISGYYFKYFRYSRTPVATGAIRDAAAEFPYYSLRALFGHVPSFTGNLEQLEQRHFHPDGFHRQNVAGSVVRLMSTELFQLFLRYKRELEAAVGGAA